MIPATWGLLTGCAALSEVAFIREVGKLQDETRILPGNFHFEPLEGQPYCFWST